MLWYKSFVIIWKIIIWYFKSRRLCKFHGLNKNQNENDSVSINKLLTIWINVDLNKNEWCKKKKSNILMQQGTVTKFHLCMQTCLYKWHRCFSSLWMTGVVNVSSCLKKYSVFCIFRSWPDDFYVIFYQ